MFALRTLSRSAPRAATRALTQPMRQQFSVAALTRQGLIQTSWRQAAVAKVSAAFSTSRINKTNEELSVKLESEAMIEKEMRNSDTYSEDIKDYLDNSPFELHDTPGQEEVALSRKYNDETVRVSFSIADIHNMDHEADDVTDPAMFDEGDMQDMPTDTQSGGANTKGSVQHGSTRDGNIKVAPEDSISPADRPELEDEPVEDQSQDTSFPARVSVTVERPKKGALEIEAIVEDGEMVIENVAYYADAEMVHAKTAEKDWAKRSIYTGPPFGNLDEDLQVLLERYLDERGVNTSMALFIPNYIDFKEQREYLRWLSNLKNFVEP